MKKNDTSFFAVLFSTDDHLQPYQLVKFILDEKQKWKIDRSKELKAELEEE